jgi:hypothetical protein
MQISLPPSSPLKEPAGDHWAPPARRSQVRTLALPLLHSRTDGSLVYLDHHAKERGALSRNTVQPPVTSPPSAHITTFSADGIVAQNPAMVAVICPEVGATMATPVPVIRLFRYAELVAVSPPSPE